MEITHFIMLSTSEIVQHTYTCTHRQTHAHTDTCSIHTDRHMHTDACSIHTDRQANAAMLGEKAWTIINNKVLNKIIERPGLVRI